jgi:L-rhamnose mutarotase
MGGVKRYGQVIKVRPDKVAEYKEWHRKVWPEVLSMITACNMRNYTIFFHDNYLFAYFEYIGSDFQADMDKMAADPKTQEWWDIQMPLQQPLESRKEGDWWADMEEVFHID